MPKLPRNASKSAKREAMREEMSKFGAGELHIGSKTGPRVTSRRQAIAIALSVSGQSRKGSRSKSRKRSRESGRR